MFNVHPYADVILPVYRVGPKSSIYVDIKAERGKLVYLPTKVGRCYRKAHCWICECKSLEKANAIL